MGIISIISTLKYYEGIAFNSAYPLFRMFSLCINTHVKYVRVLNSDCLPMLLKSEILVDNI